jgi:hypothetical protein
MWAVSCGGRHVEGGKWGEAFGGRHVEGGMWREACGGRHVEGGMWATDRDALSNARPAQVKLRAQGCAHARSVAVEPAEYSKHTHTHPFHH